MNDHSFDITRGPQGLCQQGCLVSDLRRRWSQYSLEWRHTAGPLFQVPDQIPDQAALGSNSIQAEGGSPQVGLDSTHLPGDSIHLGQEEGPGLAASDQTLLETLSLPVRGTGKVSEALIRETILSLCQGRFLTAGGLGELLNRDPVNLRSRFLSPMMDEKALRLLHEDRLNHPEQAYQTKDQ